MRWCQAQAEDQLPPVYADLALAKKGNRRATIQAAVSNAMEVLGYAQDFPITTKIASRVVDLEWAHQSTDDLSTGLHVFTLGWLTAAETEDAKRLNAVADVMFSGLSAPSVSDCQVWMSDQARSDYPLPIPALIEVFSEIARKRDWAPDLPPSYFQLDAPSGTPSVGGMSDLTDRTLSTDGTGSGAPTPGHLLLA
jgi:hypothetical protein